MAINVTSNIANVTVNTTSNVVTVSSTPVNVTLSATSVVSNASVRQAITVSNLSGFGNLAYDSSNVSNGVIQYTGVSTSDIRQQVSVTDTGGDGSLAYNNSSGVITYTGPNAGEVRAHISAASPITYNSGTGVIGLEQTLDDLTLKKYQETIVAGGNATGNISVDVTNGTIHKFTLTGNVTKIDTPSISTGGSATIILTQDSTGGHVIDTATNPLNWTQWDFVNDFTSLDTTANAFNILNVLWDGSKYYASLTTDSEIIPDSLTVTGNITSTAGYFIGDGSQLTGMGDHLTNAQVQTYIETYGLGATANLTTTANLNSAGFVTTGNATVGLDLNVLGNLEVTGNINYREVEDLLVRDQTITMNFGNAAAQNAQIIVDRSGSGSANTDIKWNEATDKWQFTNNGTTYYPLATSTSDLAEGTNLYWTTARGDANFDTRLATKSTSDLAEGTNLYYTDARAQAALSTTTAGASAGGSLAYDNGTGVFTFAPADLSTKIALTDLSVTTATASGDGALAYDDTSGVFTFTPADVPDTTDGLTEGTTNLYYTDARVQTKVANLTGNITTTGNLLVNFVDTKGLHSNAQIIIEPDSLAQKTLTLDPGLDNPTGNAIIGFNSATGAYPLGIYTKSPNANIEIIQGNVKAVTFTQFVAGSPPYEARAEFTSNIHMPGNVVTIKSDGNITSTANISGAYILGDGSQLTNIPHPADAVTSVNGEVGVVVLDTDDIAEGTTNQYYTDARVQTKVANLTGDVTTTANVSGANVNTDHISSASAQPLQLKGQTNGIELDTTIATVESRIFDTDTTGYSVADADLGSENITTVNTPQILSVFYGTAGSTTLTCVGLAAASGIYTAFEQTAGFPYPGAYWNPGSAGAQTSLEMALTTSGSTLGGVAWDGLANLSGWAIYDVTSASSTSMMSAAGHIVSISGNTVTLSEPLLQNTAGTGSPYAPMLLIPGAFSSTQNMGLRITGNKATNAMAYSYAQTGYNAYDLPETLANVTLDRVSYGNTSTVDLANVVMRHSADIQTGPDSAIRIPRAMLIGANATPDLLSVGTNSPLPSTSTLGLTIEQDGLTNYGPVETIPQMKVMLNNYKTGSLASQTAYPNWSQFLGQSGNATVDMKFLGAPNFNFKLLGGTKNAFTSTSPGDIPGRITWNPAITTGFSGSDLFNPPASITAMIGGVGDPTSMANVDMYFQSTSPFSYRDGTTTASSIPNTFLASQNGTTTIAANQFGKISLQPTRDYGDNATGDTYIDNRYANKLHEYHTFLDAGFGNANTKSGTIVNIQSKSGQQFGTTTGFNYDSSGDATLRLSTHNTDNTTKGQWDIEANKTSGNLSIINSINSASLQTVVNINSARVHIDNSLKLQNLTTTEINALVGPEAGDTVYNTTLDKVCVYSGSTDGWQQVSSTAM